MLLILDEQIELLGLTADRHSSEECTPEATVAKIPLPKNCARFARRQRRGGKQFTRTPTNFVVVHSWQQTNGAVGRASEGIGCAFVLCGLASAKRFISLAQSWVFARAHLLFNRRGRAASNLVSFIRSTYR